MKFRKLYLNLTGNFSGTYISEDCNFIKINKEIIPYTNDANILNQFYGEKERRINRKTK